MPRLRRRLRHTARSRTVTRAMLEYLACGRNFLRGDILVTCLGEGFGPDPDRDEMRSTWKQCRDELLAAARPGCRPWAWWQFDSPEPRASDTRTGPRGEIPRGPLEHQALQLLQMGEIGSLELAALKREWAPFTGYGCTPALRRWYGIPDWYNPTESERTSAATEPGE